MSNAMSWLPTALVPPVTSPNPWTLTNSCKPLDKSVNTGLRWCACRARNKVEAADMSQTTRQATTILVVEDEPGDYNLAKSFARMAGLARVDGRESVIWAQTLAEAIAAAGRE